MINSRKIQDLTAPVAVMAMKHIQACKELGIDLLITSTYRDSECQDSLYAQGRTKPGRIVTNARGGQSFHNYRVAYDVVPLQNGKPLWDSEDPVWQTIGAVGKSIGLEWAGDWKKNREFPHFQYTGGLSLADFKAGKRI